jgi:long-chain acyl-CoA synthetase
MRHASTPALVPAPTQGNLTDHVETNGLQFPSTVALSIETSSGWTPMTCQEFRDQVRGVAKGLIADGLQPGDRIAIFSRTRPEWTIADYAIWYAGGITVPIYETSSAEQVQWIMQDSHVIATFFEATRTLYPFNEIKNSVPHMSLQYVFADHALTELIERGQTISDAQLDERRAIAQPHDVATIIYTSGTTGQPKGCMMTHGNLMAECDNLIAGIPDVFARDEASTLLFLPLAHVFGRLIQLAMIRARVTIGHTPNPGTLLKDLHSFKPTFLLAVPRVFEKVYNGAQSKAHDASHIKGIIFDAAANTAIAYSESLDAGGPSKILSAKHSLFDTLVYSKLRDAMGGRVSHAISGGASLGSRLGHFYRGLGLTVLEGYGLTETSAGSTLNVPGAIKIGSVGKPVFGTEVQIADDGEILLRGHHIFKGYWNNESATREALSEDGWFHSGDIGRLDDEGYLFITGRKKELLVTSAGKNVSPNVLEDRLRSAPIISQCVVVGDARPYISALVTLDQEALPAILKAHDIEEAPLAELIENPEVRALVQQAVNTANEAVSNSEAIKKFKILPLDLTIDNGYLTPKLSIKRHVINADFAADIDSLYK